MTDTPDLGAQILDQINGLNAQKAAKGNEIANLQASILKAQSDIKDAELVVSAANGAINALAWVLKATAPDAESTATAPPEAEKSKDKKEFEAIAELVDRQISEVEAGARFIDQKDAEFIGQMIDKLDAYQSTDLWKQLQDSRRVRLSAAPKVNTEPQKTHAQIVSEEIERSLVKNTGPDTAAGFHVAKVDIAPVPPRKPRKERRASKPH